jgi:hypothetical protein
MKQKKQDGTTISDTEKYEMQKQRLDKQIEHKAAMKNILTNDQYEKWEKTMQQKGKKGKSPKKSGNKKGMQNNGPQNRQPK